MKAASLLLLGLLTSAPAVTVDEIVAGNRGVLDGIDDFICVMTFNIRSASIRVPDTRVKIHYKKPDLMKPVPLDGDFTVLPKTYHVAVGNVLERMMEGHTARLLGEETVGGRVQYRLKVTPDDDGTGIEYHLVDVDRERFTVTRVRTYAEEEQPVTVTMTHQRHGRGWLPATSTMDAYHRPEDGGELERIRVSLKFTKYQVNTGLSEAFFRDEDDGG